MNDSHTLLYSLLMRWKQNPSGISEKPGFITGILQALQGSAFLRFDSGSWAV